MSTPNPSIGAFRSLRRALARRRIRQTEPLLLLELGALAALAGGFLFWQFRVPLDGIGRARGPAAVAIAIAGVLAASALGAGAVAFARHRRALARGPAGPAWLALPLEARDLARHLAWESAGPAWLAALPSLAVLAAGWGLVPAWWLPLLAAGFAWLLAEAIRLATGLAFRAALAAAPARAGLAPIERILTRVAEPRGSARRPPARWRRAPVWRALWLKDLALTLAATPARARALPPIAFAVASVAVWSAPIGPAALRHALAFALTLMAAAALAEWLIALAGCDPFAALRALPVGAGAMWLARFAWAPAFVAVLLAAHAVAARDLAPEALRVFGWWTGVASLAIAALGVNYGVTLFPRADLARRLLGLSLGLAVAASLMLPLAGWVLLLAAVIHSARRLARWPRLEPA